MPNTISDYLLDINIQKTSTYVCIIFLTKATHPYVIRSLHLNILGVNLSEDQVEILTKTWLIKILFTVISTISFILLSA